MTVAPPAVPSGPPAPAAAGSSTPPSPRCAPGRLRRLLPLLGPAGRDLPQLCREHYPRPVSRLLWVQAEAVAVATDLAGVVGGAIALNLLFGVPLLPGGLVVGGVACALLAVHQRHPRRFELLVVALFGGVLVWLLTTLGQTDPDPALVAGGLVPGLTGVDSVVLATGVLAATVFFRPGVAAPDDLEGVHAGLADLAGPLAAGAFAVALLLSGFVSSGVGTYAGQVIMDGFLRRRVPLWVRRVVTLGPAVLLLGLGAAPTTVLLVSQVVLSFGIPFALVPVLLLGRRRDVVGELVTRPAVTAVAGVLAAVVTAVNGYLVVSVLA